jgi:TRAP-type mannitol/chloroaromatic compound transport system permease small subunit
MLASGEMSGNVGGLIRWPAMLTLPLGFALVTLQGVAEVIKRVAWLLHLHDMELHYERPRQ